MKAFPISDVRARARTCKTLKAFICLHPRLNARSESVAAVGLRTSVCALLQCALSGPSQPYACPCDEFSEALLRNLGP